MKMRVEIDKGGTPLAEGKVSEHQIMIRGRLPIWRREAQLGEMNARLLQSAKEHHARATHKKNMVELLQQR